jgi:hypothetical protein
MLVYILHDAAARPLCCQLEAEPFCLAEQWPPNKDVGRDEVDLANGALP